MNQSASLKGKGKKGIYFVEILMLKSIIALLILTFFLLNEMQASNYDNTSIIDNQSEKVCASNPESH